MGFPGGLLHAGHEADTFHFCPKGADQTATDISEGECGQGSFSGPRILQQDSQAS